jgi:hypothetical protein
MNSYQNFHSDIADHHRVWVYQAERFFTDAEVVEIQNRANAFVKQWTAHELPLSAKAMVLFNLFLVITVDEQVHQASGCSIDKSVALIKQLNNDYQVDLLQRNNIALLQDDKIQIMLLTQIMKDGVEGDALFFNNMIQTGNQLKTQWIVKAKDAWLSRYMLAETK